MNFATIGQNIVKLFIKYWDKFLITGLEYTLSLAAITVCVGAVFGALIALMRMSRIAPLRWIAAVYTEIIRGTPMLLQLYLFYFALPMLIPILNKQQYACVAIALTCNSAAYVSEIFRSGIQAVDIGQTEAARSLGLSQRLTMTEIILPQAIKNILPALANEFIMVIKDTSRHLSDDRAADHRRHHLFCPDLYSQQGRCCHGKEDAPWRYPITKS